MKKTKKKGLSMLLLFEELSGCRYDVCVEMKVSGIGGGGGGMEGLGGLDLMTWPYLPAFLEIS